MRMRSGLAVLALAFCAVPIAQAATTIGVPADQPTIQAGINAAANGDTVLVAPGTYNEVIDFLGKAITVESSGGAKVTTIQPPTQLTAVIVGGSGATIAFRGFTVRGAPSVGGTPFAGAVNALNGAGVIEHNVFTGHESCNSAGIKASGAITVRHNVIWGNRVLCTGGGLVSTVQIGSGAVFSDNLVAGNRGGNSPIGVEGTGVVTRNVVAHNASALNGAATVSGGEFSNNLVLDNDDDRLYLDGFGNGNVVNNTVVGNSAGILVRPVLPTSSYIVRNNTFEGGGIPLLECDTSYEPTLPVLESNNFFAPQGSIVGTGSSCTNPTGTSGNVSVDSGFVSRALGDFHLAPGSPLIDAGSATGAPILDGDKDPRPLDGSAGPAGAQWDIGFDEAAEAGNAVDTTITGGPGASVGAVVPPFTFTSTTVGASFECNVDMGGFVPCTSPFVFPTGPQRIYSFSVRAKHGAGVVDRTPATRLFTVDLAPPDTTVDPPTGGDSSPVWTISFTSTEAGSTFECALDAAAPTTCTSPLVLQPGVGAHSISVRATDAAGNSDTTPALAGWTVKCTVPGSPIGETVSGTSVADGLCGEAGDDLLLGFEGADLLFGGPENDVLDGGPGADQINGETGIADVVDYSDRSTSVTVVLGDGLPDGGVEDGAGDTIDASVEDIWGGSANDALTGDAGDNALDGGLGADTMNGGSGSDFVDYSLATTPVTADMDGAAGDDGRAGEGDTIGTDVEAIFGGAASDTLSGEAGGDVLDGGPGNDTINGRNGSDLLIGGPGDDTIEAADGVLDEIDCGPGADIANTDPIDQVFDCEVRNEGPVAPTPTPTPSPPAPPPGPSFAPSIAQTRFPRAARTIHRLLMTGTTTGNSRTGIVVPVRCESTREPTCRIKVTASTHVTTAGKTRTVILGSAEKTVTQGVLTRVKIKLNGRAMQLFATRARLKVKLEGGVFFAGVFKATASRTLFVSRFRPLRK